MGKSLDAELEEILIHSLRPMPAATPEQVLETSGQTGLPEGRELMPAGRYNILTAFANMPAAEDYTL